MRAKKIRYRNLAQKTIAEQSRYAVVIDKNNEWGIYDKEKGAMESESRWTSRKSAEDYLAISLTFNVKQ